jgi:HEAT repeat protein
LRLIGSDESVPALAALLTDEELSHCARYALEQMRTPAAGAALRDALGRARGKLLAGVIGSLGERGDAGAVPALAELVRDRDETVAAAAVAALGDIGGWEAARALAGRRKDVQDALVPVVTDAQLKCAEWMLARGNPWEAAEIYRGMLETTAPEVVRAAGLRGMLLARGPGAVPLVIEFLKGDDRAMAVTAARLAGAVPGEAVTRALAAELQNLAPAVQVTLLGVLEARGDPAARTAVVAATKSPEEPVRVAALAALGRLGDASTVPLLAGAAAAGPGSERKAAARSLDRLRGAGVTDAMVAEIGRAAPSGQKRRPDRAEAGTRRVLVRSLAARGAADAVPALVEAAEDADEAVRRESIKALGALGSVEVLPFLLDLLTETRDKSARRETERAVGAVCARSEGKSECSRLLVSSYPRAATEARCAILRLTAAVGGTEALALVRKAVGDRDREIGKAAVRALANWPDPAPTDDLLEMARTSPGETHRVLALRGYVAMVERGRRKPEEKLGMLKTAMDLARRPEERKLVLKGASAVRTADGLSFIVRHLDDANLRMEAAGALVAMARDDRFRKANRRDLKSALEKARGFVADKRLAGEIRKYLRRIGR